MSRASTGVRRMAVDFWRFGRDRSRRAAALIGAGAVLEAAGLLTLIPVIGLIVDQDAGASVFHAAGLVTPNAQIAVVLLIFAAVLGARFVVILLRDDLLIALEQDFVTDLRNRAFARLASMPWPQLQRLRQSPAGHALTRDADRAAEGASLLIEAGVAVTILVIQLAIALWLAPLITAAVALTGLVLFAMLAGLRRRAEAHGRELTDRDLRMYDAVRTFLDGLKPAKAHGLDRAYVARFADAAAQVGASRRAFAWDYTLARLTMQTAAGAIAMAAILAGVMLADVPAEHLVVTLIILARLYAPVQALQNAAQSIAHAAPAYRAISELAGPGPALPPAAGPAIGVPRLTRPPEITLENVGWEQDGVHVLSGIEARFAAGAVTAIAGPSGAGKSTMLDLITGLLRPTAGRILLDGEPYTAERIASLRASLAYVGQEPFLFDASLRENVTWGCGPVGEDAIWRALAVTGAADLAGRLEGGIDGRIRADGARFSGGERQRLRLARALLRRPRLLVLDEAASALDDESEIAVLRAVLGDRGGATVVLVSHRSAVLDLADLVVRIEGGQRACGTDSSAQFPEPIAL